MLQSHIHMCGMAILYFSALNLKIFSTRLNERCEFLVAIVAWVEIWAFLKDKDGKKDTSKNIHYALAANAASLVIGFIIPYV